MPVSRRGEVAQLFRTKFEAEASLWARAPGRVDLMGSHTDYNLGYVLTLPIGRDTWIAASPREDGFVSVFSLNLDAEATFKLEHVEKDPGKPWRNYLSGVASALQGEG